MDIKQALSILQPKKNNEDGLKASYRAACMRYHPDHGGDIELMKLVNLAYETLVNCDRWWTPYEARQAGRVTPLTETMAKLWDAIKRFPGIQGEIIGSWLWVSGDTRSYRKELKGLGFKFSRKKAAWYYHEGGYRKRSKREFSMDDIRNVWGAEDLATEQSQSIAA